MNIFPLKQLSYVEALETEADVFVSLEKERNTQEVMQEVYTFFARQHFDRVAVQPFLSTHWRWYVRACWLYMDGISPQMLVRFLAPSVPSAFSLEFSCLDLYIAFLSDQTADDTQINIKNVQILFDNIWRLCIIPSQLENEQLSYT